MGQPFLWCLVSTTRQKLCSIVPQLYIITTIIGTGKPIPQQTVQRGNISMNVVVDISIFLIPLNGETH